MVPSGFQQTNLVSYESGLAPHTDPNLNGWGMTALPDGSFVVANAFTTGLATFYSASGHVLAQTIIVPGSAGGSAALGLGPGGHPTGVVYNPTSDFVISEDGRSAPATLIFDSIDGTISGWNPAVDPTHAILIRDTWTPGGTDSVFTGLEIGQETHGNKVINVLYAADFLNNQLEVINGSFTTISTINCAGLGVSSDPDSWVWSVQAVNDKLYVTFADLFGPTSGGGAVDVFDMDGNFQYQLAANGPGPGRLQNPWGIIQAPGNFGAYSNDLLIGNVAGAGNINVYNPHTGAYLGQLDQPNGAPIAIKGLWDLEFGDGTPQGGKTNQLFFDAGPNHPGDSTGGLFGVIQPAGHQGRKGDHGRHNTPPIGDLGPGCAALLAGLQAQPATSPSPAPAAGAAGSSQAISPPAGLAPGLPAYWVSDLVFADLQSLALAPTDDPPWSW